MKRAIVASSFALAAAGCLNPVVPAPVAMKRPEQPAKLVAMTKAFAVPVLMYHRVCNLTPREERSPLIRDLTVSPDDFETQIRYLTENGYSFLLVSEVETALREGKELPVKSIALTLDDGYRDNFTQAFPILRKYGARATVFMTTSNFGRPERLSQQDAQTMVGGNVGFQSHSVTHPDLTTLSDAALERELVDSKSCLEKLLNVRVSSIAYPGGTHDNRTIEAVRRADYVAAWDKGGGPVEPRHADDPYRLPRVRVHGRTDMRDFRRKVESGYWAMRMKSSQRA